MSSMRPPAKNSSQTAFRGGLKIFGLLLAGLTAAAVVAAAVIYLRGVNVAVLNPAGPIGRQERDLIVIATWLAAVVIIPVYALTVFVVWRYRDHAVTRRPKAKYSPEWSHNRLIETIWWAIPCAIIGVLAVITWTSSHRLDPYRRLASSQPTLNIQVVALDWKWLFIYPAQNVASVNFVQLPVGVPVDFQITSAGPMNSFWIPQLGSQIYAMAGMTSRLHLMASRSGDFAGSSANISGRGFSGMRFTARAGSQADFDHWLKTVRAGSRSRLDAAAYVRLSAPSSNNPVAYYSSVEPGLYDRVVMSFMMPAVHVNGGGAPAMAGGGM